MEGRAPARPSRRGVAGAPPSSFAGALPRGLLISLVLATSSFGAPIQPSACAQAAKYSDARHGTSLLVIQNGQTIFEHYANGGGEDAAWPIFSGTKNFWGIAALVAINEGTIRLDEPVSNTITEWRGDPRKSKITIRQLLTFTDGLEPASFLHRDSIADRNALAIRVSSVASPGAAFTYGPSHPQIFCELLRRKLNGASTFNYLQQHVLGPLGIGSFEYKQDRKGNPLFATGFRLSARQWVRLGEMILSHGSFDGHQIVPSDSLQQAFVGTSANPNYGLSFWLNRSAGFLSSETDIEKRLDLPWQRASWRGVCISKTAPSDMIAAIGSHYQRQFIIPSMNLVIVRQSSADAKFSDGEFLRVLLKH